MTLDYAIRHAKEVALTCEDSKCAAEHAQLAEWLIELKISREHPFSELQDEFRHLAEENERLRNENTRLNAKMSTRLYGINAADVKRYREASDGLCMEECKRILVEQAREGEVDRLVNENAKLCEQVTQLQCDWESERDYASQMEAKEKQAVAENALLREFAKYVLLCSEGDVRCVACPFHANREDGSYVLCGARKAARSLGVEVEE